MREVQELSVAPRNVILGQCLEPVQAIIFAVERPHNVAMHQRPLEMSAGQFAALFRGRAGQIAPSTWARLEPSSAGDPADARDGHDP